MAMAGNDVEYAARQAGRLNTDGRPEFGYWVRVTNGSTFEATRALQAWRQRPEIRKFLNTLDAKGREHLKQVSGLEQRMGTGALEEVRQQTFHYPQPDPARDPDSAERLREVLRDREEAPVEMDKLADGSIRFTFADEIALSLALGKHLPADDPGFRRQADAAMEGAAAFANLATDIVLAYFDRNDVGMKLEP